MIIMKKIKYHGAIKPMTDMIIMKKIKYHGAIKPMTDMKSGELCNIVTPFKEGKGSFVYKTKSIDFIVINLNVDTQYDYKQAKKFYVSPCDKDTEITVTFKSSLENL